MEPARFWLLWLINIHDHSKVTSLFPSSSNFSPSWFFIFKRSFIHLVLSGNRLVASLVNRLSCWWLVARWTRIKRYFLRLLLTQRFLTFRRIPCVKIKDTDDVLPIKEDPATPMMEIIPLYFARCMLPMHRNQQVKSSLHSRIFDIPMHPVREDQRHGRRFAC